MGKYNPNAHTDEQKRARIEAAKALVKEGWSTRAAAVKAGMSESEFLWHRRNFPDFHNFCLNYNHNIRLKRFLVFPKEQVR